MLYEVITHLGLYVGNFEVSRKDRTHPVFFLNRFHGLDVQRVPTKLFYQLVLRPQFKEANLRLGVLDNAHEFLGSDPIEILLGVGGKFHDADRSIRLQIDFRGDLSYNFV